MTPEERAEQVHLDSICRDDFGQDELDEVRRDIAQAIREAKIEAYEEAIKATCPHCANHVHIEKDEAGTWFHVETAWGWAECEADQIHRLKDSLAETTHEHTWIDARNEVVVSGEICLCGAIRASSS
jgi:hypothetical protein